VAQLTFQRIDLAANPIDAPMVVTYAPGELAFTKAAVYADVPIPGLEQPLLQFVRGEAETLSMDLFFDSSAAGTGAGAVAVTEQVEAFHKLVSVNGDLQRCSARTASRCAPRSRSRSSTTRPSPSRSRRSTTARPTTPGCTSSPRARRCR
jgi:hypothetical protein